MKTESEIREVLGVFKAHRTVTKKMHEEGLPNIDPPESEGLDGAIDSLSWALGEASPEFNDTVEEMLDVKRLGGI